MPAPPLMADPTTVLRPDSITDAMKPDVMPLAGLAGMVPASPVAPVEAANAMQAPVAAVAPGAAANLGAGVMPPAAMQTGGAAPALPPEGVLQGKAMLNPALAPKVPEGSPRPLAMAEHVINPDGSTSNEISVTVQDKSLNDGKPTLLPSLWVVNGKPTRVSDDQAVEFAKQSGLTFKSFKTIDEAEKFANDRETAWQTTKPEDAGKVEPLWSQSSAKDSDKAEPVEVTSKPATGLISLTPERIKSILSDPEIQARLKAILKPNPKGPEIDTDTIKAAERASGQ